MVEIAAEPNDSPATGRDERPRKYSGRMMGHLIAVTLAGLVSIGTVAGPLIMQRIRGPELDPLDSQCTALSGRLPFKVVWPNQPNVGPLRGGNGAETDWLVFYFKPYCGACKRVRPAFRALAATTNSTKHSPVPSLRFGEVDCVAERGVCSILEAERTPLFRLYRMRPANMDGSGIPMREIIAEWKGILIGYELVDWVKLQQREGKIAADVEFGTPDEVGAAMRRFRARGNTQHDTSVTRAPEDPAGQVCVEVALDWSPCTS